MLVFVDTNILLYARDASEPAKQPLAASWLDHLWEQRTGRISVQVLSEYYTNVCHKLSRPLLAEPAWDDVKAYFSWKPRRIDEEVLTEGREIQVRWRLSWWDCLIVAAARLEGCALLLSEDLQDGLQVGGLTVRDPFRLRVEEAVATYEAGRRPRRSVRRA